MPSDQFTSESDVRHHLRTLEIQMAQLMNSNTNNDQIVKSNTTSVTSTRQKEHHNNQPATNGQSSSTSDDDAHAAHETPIVGEMGGIDEQEWRTVNCNCQIKSSEINYSP